MNDLAIWLLVFVAITTTGVLLEAFFAPNWDDDEPIDYTLTERDWFDGGYPR